MSLSTRNCPKVSNKGRRTTNSSTAVARESQMAPVVAVLFVLCTLAGLRPLVATAVRITPQHNALAWLAWSCAVIVWGVLVGLDLKYWISHGKTSTGMLPPTIASLVPATGVTLALVEAHEPALGALWTAFGVSSAALIGLLVCFFVLYRASTRPHEIDRDAVVLVLGGAIRHGQPSETLLMRLRVATRLWHESPDRVLVLTGGPVPDDDRCEADYMFDELVESGVAPDSMLLERHARNTNENIRYSLQLIADANIRGQLCVLTSDYHIYRALREASYCGVELTPIASPTPPRSRLQQWSREALTFLVLP